MLSSKKDKTNHLTTLTLVFCLAFSFPLSTGAQGFQLFGGNLNIFGGLTRLFTQYNPTVEPEDTTPYVEDVFSAYTYTGNGAFQRIVNNMTLDPSQLATIANTTASSNRGTSLGYVFTWSGYFIFNTVNAGETLTVDLGTAQDVDTMQYKNAVGADWAPTSVLVQYSSNGSTWTTVATHVDSADTTLQTISFATTSARYWRLYQNSNTRANSSGYEWHLNSFKVGLSTLSEAGMVWLKSRSAIGVNKLFDTERGASYQLTSDSTGAQLFDGDTLVDFDSTGFTIDADANINTNSNTYASWTFKESPEFFDVVTYTGDGTSGRAIAHNLGVAPGMVIIKRTDSTSSWVVYHRSVTDTNFKTLFLNNTDALSTPGDTFWSTSDMTSSTFGVGNSGSTNLNTATYVAYLFAHVTSDDGIIQAGSFTTDGSGNATVDLGWEPQFLLIKDATAAGSWYLADTARGFSVGGFEASTNSLLSPNSSSAESVVSSSPGKPTANGFVAFASASHTHVYLAIRKGPMQTPTDGGGVYYAINATSTGATTLYAPFPADLSINTTLSSGNYSRWNDRLRGYPAVIKSDATSAEETGENYSASFDTMLGINRPNGYPVANQFYWMFRRTPWVFDIVAYTGDGNNNRNVTHNLGLTPELIIVKRLSGASAWRVWHSDITSGENLELNATDGDFSDTSIGEDHTIITFDVNNSFNSNASNERYVAYLFSTRPLVSKVGSYTGNGSTQNINASFSATARFIMIKRTDTNGDWYVWDSTRGIVAGNDPHISLNTLTAQVTTDDSIDPYSLGFTVNQDAATNINVNAATYIYLAFQ